MFYKWNKINVQGEDMKKIVAIAIAISFTPVLGVFNESGASTMVIQNEIYGLAVDSHGNVVVVGQYDTGSKFIMRMQKYDGATGKLIWQRDYDESSTNIGKAVAIDSNDNIYVGGIVGKTIANVELPSTDYILIKYDKNGNEMWSKTYNKHFADFLMDAGVDEDENILLTGMTLAFDVTSQQLTNVNFWTIKANAATGNMITQNEYDKEKLDAAFGMDVRGSDVVVAGSVEENNISRYAVIKYDNNLNMKWFRTYGENATASDAVILSDGNIAVVGNRNEDIWVVMLDSNGNKLWDRAYGTNKKDDGLGIDCDTKGNVIAGGYVTENGVRKWHMIKYDSNGNEIWNKNMKDKDGNVIYGEIKRVVCYGDYIIAAGYRAIGDNMEEYFVAKYDSDGNIVWQGNNEGVTEVKADFSYMPANPTRADVVVFSDKSTGAEEWYWEFGDGNTSNERNPRHQYTKTGAFQVNLTVRGAGGEDTKSVTITVTNAIPSADFAWQPPAPVINETITFDASASRDEDGVIVNYTWNFGDNTTAYGKVVEHSYAHNGEYKVILTVTDNDGAYDNEIKMITVNNITGNKPPIAEFSYTPSSPSAREEVTLNASSSYDEDGTIELYRWDFDGDGKYDMETTNPVITHTWDDRGEYIVTLQVVDNSSLTNTYTKSINVGGVEYLMLYVDDSISLIKGAEREVKITVKNIAPYEIKNITIEITKNGNVDFNISNTRFDLAPGGKKEIILTLSAENDSSLKIKATGYLSSDGSLVSSEVKEVEIKITKGTPGFGIIIAFVSILLAITATKWKKK